MISPTLLYVLMTIAALATAAGSFFALRKLFKRMKTPVAVILALILCMFAPAAMYMLPKRVYVVDAQLHMSEQVALFAAPSAPGGGAITKPTNIKDPKKYYRGVVINQSKEDLVVVDLAYGSDLTTVDIAVPAGAAVYVPQGIDYAFEDAPPQRVRSDHSSAHRTWLVTAARYREMNGETASDDGDR